MRRSFVHSMAEISCEQREAIEVKVAQAHVLQTHLEVRLRVLEGQLSPGQLQGWLPEKSRENLERGDGVCSIINNKWRTRRLTSLT